MRSARILGEKGTSYYHCVNRVIEKRFLLGEEEKEFFVQLMRKVEAFSGAPLQLRLALECARLAAAFSEPKNRPAPLFAAPSFISPPSYLRVSAVLSAAGASLLHQPNPQHHPSTAPQIPSLHTTPTATCSDGTMTYTYNDQNRLTSAQPTVPVEADLKSTYLYDHLGRRLQKQSYSRINNTWVLATTINYTYDRWNLIREDFILHTISDTATNTYTWGPDLHQSTGGIGGLLSANLNGTQVLYHHDHNGNIIFLTQDDPVNQWDYMGFKPSLGPPRAARGEYGELSQNIVFEANQLKVNDLVFLTASWEVKHCESGDTASGFLNIGWPGAALIRSPLEIMVSMRPGALGPTARGRDVFNPYFPGQRSVADSIRQLLHEEYFGGDQWARAIEVSRLEEKRADCTKGVMVVSMTVFRNTSGFTWRLELLPAGGNREVWPENHALPSRIRKPDFGGVARAKFVRPEDLQSLEYKEAFPLTQSFRWDYCDGGFGADEHEE